ncbi:MAG: SDR family oxidoreductase [Rhodospirillaceae bacterium]|nr:SDR family oxidoreductase [Rhodospirillaceae bacterium]
MPSVLITGSGRGIGVELARQYAAADWTVYATLRNTDRAAALLAIQGDVKVLELDVADPESITTLAGRMAGTPIDLLINNAGIYGPRGLGLGGLSYGDWEQVLAVNTLGPVRMVEAFLEHLRAGEQKKIAAITSKMGSIAENTSGANYIYRSSKAALNATMKSVALDLKGEGFSVAIIHPGWVRTDMGGPNALIEPRQSVQGMRRVIEAATPATTGRFYNYDGTEIPW